jgi:hypothetical protein
MIGLSRSSTGGKRRRELTGVLEVYGLSMGGDERLSGEGCGFGDC